jgi:hypothetical protein
MFQRDAMRGACCGLADDERLPDRGHLVGAELTLHAQRAGHSTSALAAAHLSYLASERRRHPCLFIWNRSVGAEGTKLPTATVSRCRVIVLTIELPASSWAAAVGPFPRFPHIDLCFPLSSMGTLWGQPWGQPWATIYTAVPMEPLRIAAPAV